MNRRPVLYARISDKLHADLLTVSAMCGLSLSTVTEALMRQAIHGETTPAWPAVHHAILIYKRNVN